MTCLYCNDDPVVRVNCYCRDAMKATRSFVPHMQQVGRALRPMPTFGNDPCDEWVKYEREHYWWKLKARVTEMRLGDA